MSDYLLDNITLNQVVHSIWVELFGLTAHPLSEVAAADDHATDIAHWSAQVDVAGSWNGSIALHTGDALGRRLAAVLFGLDEATMSAHDIEDALGELANILGGNLKPLLPGPCRLQLPVSRREPASRLSASESPLVARRRFRWQDDVFEVCVFQGQLA